MLPFMDELNGRIEPGYERVENSMCAQDVDNEKIRRDIRQAKFALIVTEAIIDTVLASEGSTEKLFAGTSFPEILNTATRALLEVE